MKYQFISILIIIILIILRYFLLLPIYKQGDSVRITTRIYSDPIRYETAQYIKLENLKTYLPLFPEINYGDEVVVVGVVDGDKLKNPKLLSVNQNKNLTAKFRNNLISFYQSVLPEPYAGLIGGILLGNKGGLTSNFWQMVKSTGVAHVVVASGTNVTFIANYIFAIAIFFIPRRKAIWFVMLSILLYLFISGFEAPLVRAAIMVSTVYLAQLIGREINSWKVLLATVLVMLLVKPTWIGDIGFILSFVSTASLILFESRIRKKITFLPPFLKEGLSTSLAAQIGVTPILFVTFGQFNIWSPIVNMLVLWTIAPIMVIGAIGGLVGLVIPIFGKFIVWLSFPLLWWFVKMVEVFN